MRLVVATLIAIAALWAIDVQFNDGRYSDVVKLAARNLLR